MLKPLKTFASHDITPICVARVCEGAMRLEAKKDILLQLEMDETGEFLCATDEYLGISAYATTRDALISEIHQQFAMLWREYALESDVKLSIDAIALKTVLKSFFREV